jgi:hypothetical protein
MLPLPARSPFDGGRIIVTRFYCPDSDLNVEGQFEVTQPFANLTPEQLKFVELFIRSEGKLNRMEVEMGVSYPTVRTRLNEVIRALGYEPGKEEPVQLTEEQRRRILKDLETGSLTYDEAMALLKGSN